MARHIRSARDEPHKERRLRRAADGTRTNRRSRPALTDRSGRGIGTDRVTVMLALLTCLVLGAAVADISHSVARVITAVAVLIAGLFVTTAILRPSR
ncbi:hypothetical protein ACWCPQ_15165 [Nocardia sp. NPDC001965]